MTSLIADGLASLRDENRRLRALVDFGRQVTAERDLRAQLRLLCAELVRTTGCSAAAVILYDLEHGSIDSIETAGLSIVVDADWQQAVRGAPTGTELADLLPAGLHRVSAVPLLVGEDMLGVVLTYDRQPGDACDEEIRYLTAMADAAAMAILNTRLYAQSRRELRRRDALRKVVASISSELDLDSLLGRVVGSAVELLDADSGVVSLIDREGAARIRAVHNLPESIVGSELRPGNGISGQVLATREAVVVEHYLEEVPRPLPEAGHVESGVAVPVWWQGQLTGVFALLAKDISRVFNTQDREVMELLANHLAIAIENARLYGEVRDRLAEVTGLQAASSALAEELLPERALRVIAQQALSLSGAATVSIELLRAHGRELEVQVAVGEHALELAAMRVAVDGSLAGAAVSTGRPQILRAPFGGVSERTEARTAAERTEARSLLVLPLRARSRTLGTLSAYTHHPNAFHTRQVELLATFANQAAISLDNARLYGELQSRLNLISRRVGLGRSRSGRRHASVLAESGVPVLLLRPGGRRITHVRKLLVPIDGSPGGAVALGTAVGLVKASGATMKLLQVAVPIPTYVYAGDVYGGMGYIDPAWDEEMLANARSYVEAIVKRLRDTGVIVDGEARQAPDVAATIVAMADEVEADLIVMSTQALTGPARALLGSVADAVVRSAHCPVLLVHRDESGRVAPLIAQIEPAQPAHPVG